jgi:GPH family glycoside/pentoside/hexuronide:cation symporter
MTPRPGTVSRRSMAVVALANLGAVGLIGAMNIHLLFFYTDVLGIAPYIMNTALMISQLWDIVNDPLAGHLTDITRSRWGRRRVYLRLGALPLGLSCALLWWAPAALAEWKLFAWVLGAYLLFDTFFTLTMVALNSLVAGLSTDYDERSTLAAWASVGALVGYFLGAAGVPAVAQWWGNARTGFAGAGVALGAIATLGMLAAGFFLREPAALPPREKTDLRALLLPLRNKPFRWVLGGASIARLAFTFMTAGLPYFVVHWMKDPGGVPKTMGFVMGLVGLFIPFWRWIIGRWDKGRAYAAGLAVTGLAMASLWFTPAGGSAIAWVSLSVVGMGLASHWVAPTALLPDAIDWDEHHSGQRRDGIHFGLFGLLDKIARTLGVLMLGWGLAAVGYRGGTPSDAALTGFRALFGPGMGLLLLLAAGLMARYPLNRLEHQRLRDAMRDRAAGPGTFEP